MVKENRVVVGSYKNEDDTASVVNRLKEDGYQRDDITLYTNSANADGLKDSRNVDNAGRGTEDTEDDRSFWDKMKDAFSTDSYDYEEDSQDPNYNQEDDVLYPYKDDIKNGNTVIVVDSYRGDTNLEMNQTEDEKREEPEITDKDLNRNNRRDNR